MCKLGNKLYKELHSREVKKGQLCFNLTFILLNDPLLQKSNDGEECTECTNGKRVGNLACAECIQYINLDRIKSIF